MDAAEWHTCGVADHDAKHQWHTCGCRKRVPVPGTRAAADMERIREAGRALAADAPPLPPDVVARVAEIFRRALDREPTDCPKA